MRMVSVFEISEQIRGVTYEKSVVSTEPKENYSPVLRANNIGEYGLEFDELVFIPNKFISPKQRIFQNDVVIAASSGSISVVGKAAQAKNGFEGAFGAFCKVLRPDTTKVHPRYFGHFFGTVSYRRTVSSLAEGANINNLKNEHLDNIKFFLPPIEEQKRIAAILDAADALRVKRRESIAQLDALLQSTFLDMFGDPVTNPMRFATVSLSEIGDWQSGGTPTRTNIDYFNGEIPWFSSGELNQLFLFQSNESISKEAIKNTSAKSVPKGALMLGMYDTAALKASIVGIDCSCNQAVAFSIIDRHVADVLYVYFVITVGREHYRRLQRGVRQKNLNLSMIRGIRIPLPPLSLQRRFASIVEAAECQKARLRAHLDELDALFASLQSRAFNGEL